MRPTGAQIGVLMEQCHSFYAGNGSCCGNDQRPDLCRFHEGWLEGWEGRREIVVEMVCEEARRIALEFAPGVREIDWDGTPPRPPLAPASGKRLS